MSVSAALLASLEAISHETTRMLNVLDANAEALPPDDVREAKRRIFLIRTEAQELFDWIGAARLEEPRN